MTWKHSRKRCEQTRQDDMQTRIEEALANGEITQEHADWLLEGLEKGFLDGPLCWIWQAWIWRTTRNGWSGIPGMEVENHPTDQ